MARYAGHAAFRDERGGGVNNLLRNTVLALFVFVTAATAAGFAGAVFPETVSAGGKILKLNGLGLRKKFMFKVYVGGLYLEVPSKDAVGILASDQARAVRMVFLRDLTREQLVEGFRNGFDANAKDRNGQQAAFDRMLALIRDVKQGEALTFTYLPGKGTSLQADDRMLGTFEGRAFAEDLFLIWLGNAPPTAELKAGMLGGE
jgi:hypothetical protein